MLRFSHLVNPFENFLFMTAVLSLSIEFFMLFCLDSLQILDVNLLMKLCIAK